MKTNKAIPKWARELKVPEYICDHNHNHIRVIKIEEHITEWQPWFIRMFDAWWMPDVVSDVIDVVWVHICAEFDWYELNDIIFTLENGWKYSSTLLESGEDHMGLHCKIWRPYAILIEPYKET